MSYVKVRYFAAVRETIGLSEESVEWTSGPMTLDRLRQVLCERGQGYAAALGPDKPIRAAIDQVMCTNAHDVLPAGAEVAFFPPVTGG